MALYDYRIASGHGVALVSLTNIEDIPLISGDRFKFKAPRSYGTFNKGIRKSRGDGKIYFSGYPSAQWIWRAITLKQIEYLQDTILGGLYSGPVTIYTPTDNPGSYPQAYERWNAIMILPQLTLDQKASYVVENYAVAMTRMVAL